MVRLAYAMLMCVLFVSSRPGIVFNPIAGAITDYSQSVKDIEPYFKSQLYVEDPGNQKLVLILPNGLSKHGERTHERNFYFCLGWDSHPRPLDRQSSMLPPSYPLSISALSSSDFIQPLCLNSLLNSLLATDVTSLE